MPGTSGLHLAVVYLHADADGLTPVQHRESLELFMSDIAPVLRREIPSRPFPVPAVSGRHDSAGEHRRDSVHA